MSDRTNTGQPSNKQPTKFDPKSVHKFLGKIGHGGFLDMGFEGHGDDWVELSLNWREDLVADAKNGVLASSVVISLMDNACSIAIWNKVQEFRPQVTMDLRVDYLRPSPKGAKIFGRGICYHVTRRIGFVRGVAHNGDIDSPLAHVSGTFIRLPGGF
ncbi:hypothetical protein LPB140_03880 [Sphingorhabdus lutea]|uniref:Thioesterase domain-containing protein n=1 Tax=Sphingorhabdus lutea TaxID=1913578 RepID=A0A1L3JEH4_9SPHN|nr:hypothetical protein LPB140_03880 [Sphingorhabdus lutea]